MQYLDILLRILVAVALQAAAMPEEDEALQARYGTAGCHQWADCGRQAMMAAVKRHFDAEEFEEALPLMTEAGCAKYPRQLRMVQHRIGSRT